MPDVIARKIVLVPVEALHPHPDNPRRGDVTAIEQSITANGYYRPIVAQQSTSTILAGHGSWAAAVHLGIARVPVVWVDVDDETARRILIADNRTNDLAAYDDSALLSVLDTIAAQEGALDGTGFDEAALTLLRTRVEIESARGVNANGNPTAAVSDDEAAAVGRSIVLDATGAQAVRFDDLITILRGDAVETPALVIVLDALERAASETGRSGDV